MNRYYITWFHKTGHGATTLDTIMKIETDEEINEIRKHIQKANPECENIVIWDWKILKLNQNAYN